MTPEEAREVLAKAQAVLAEAAKQEKIAAEKAKEDAKLKERLKVEVDGWMKRKEFFEAVLAELIKLDPQATLIAAEPKLRDSEHSWDRVHPGQLSLHSGTYSYPIGFSQDRHRSWDRRETAWKCTVGDVGGRGSFPMRAQGGFNYEKIAKTMHEQKTAQEAERKAREEQATAYSASRQIVLRLVERFKLAEYFGPFLPSKTRGTHIKLNLTVSFDLTESQAVEVYEAWQEFYAKAAAVAKKPS